MKGKRADGALYWTAYALNKLGNKDQALQMIEALKKAYPSSQWIDDANALSVEVRERRGVTVRPADVDDEELKVMAIRSLMNTDPERAFPLLEKILKGPASKKVKEGAMFVLSQSSSPKAQALIADLAKGSSPALQEEAIHYLGIAGGERSRKVLLEVYNTTKSQEAKEEVLNALMISGDRARILEAAKTEKDPDLREEAIRLLGVMGARADLAAMYAAETSNDTREVIINALFVAGDSEKIGEIAKSERDPELREEAIRKLGVMGKKTAPLLLQLYATESSMDIKEAVIDGLFVQGNARALIDLSKKETNKSLKREMLQKLSVMNNKEAVDYMLEILNEE
jgi:HEAT repeat protein